MSPEDTPSEGQTPTPEATDDNTGNKPETFDRAYVESLRSENARYRTEAQAAKGEVEELRERDKSESEKLVGKLTRAEQAKAEAETRLLRYEVAAEKQVPADALDLLAGSTREELEARADRILELVKNRTNTDREPDFDGGAREPAPEPLTPEEQHNRDVVELLFGGTRT